MSAFFLMEYAFLIRVCMLSLKMIKKLLHNDLIFDKLVRYNDLSVLIILQ